MQNRPIYTSYTFFLLFLMLAGTVSAQTDAQQAEAEFTRLEAQARQMLDQGELALALEAYEAASRVKPTAILLIKMVSLYADLEKQSGQLGAHCTETADVFNRFFKACDGCSTTSSRECSVCRYVSRLGVGKDTSKRVELLGEEFGRQAKVLAAESKAQEDEDKADKLVRKSKGFEGKAVDVKHCLAEVKISSDPAGGVVSIDGQPAGDSPVTKNLLEGKYQVEIAKKGFQTVKTVVGVKAGRPTPLTFYLTKAGEKQSLLVLQSVPEGFSVKVAGAPVTDFSQPVKVKPGVVILELLQPSGEGEERKINIKAGQTRIINLAPKPGISGSAGPSSIRQTLKWSALGTGAALLVAGAVIQIGVNNDAEQANALFDDVFVSGTLNDTPENRAEISDLRDSVRQNAIIAGATMTVGGLALGAGLYLLFSEEKASATVFVSPDGGGVSWAF